MAWDAVPEPMVEYIDLKFSLGKSLGDCDVAVKVLGQVPETFSGT